MVLPVCPSFASAVLQRGQRGDSHFNNSIAMNIPSLHPARLHLGIVLFIALAICRTHADPPVTGGAAQGGPFAKGRPESEAHISTVRDTAQITYLGNTERGGEARPSRLLMAIPERFDQEGVYVWRNAEGVWNIRVVSSQAIHVTVDISAEGDIQAVGERATAIRMSAHGKARIDETEAVGEKSDVFQFSVNGSHVDFNFAINGKTDTQHLYLGRQSWNPQSASFRIENRPLAIPAGSDGQFRTTTNGAEKLNSPGAPASSGGGGGGAPPK